MNQGKKKCAGCRKENCDGCSLNPGKSINSIKDKASLLPLNFKPDKQTGYGLAFDVGTTTVAGMLVDLSSGEILAAKTCVNPQRIAGSDVAGRIAWCRKSEENRSRLQSLTIKKLDELAEELWEQASWEGLCATKKAQKALPVRKAVIVGNTVMCEIILGLDLKGLAKAPFHKEYEGSVKRTGKELDFVYLKDAEITVLPSVQGYVGADALAVYTYVKNVDERKKILAVDIGTNGEILLLGEKGDYACSAAAGPALEGAAVTQGMGAAAGAIEEVRILGSFPRQDISCRVTGHGKPMGICGSGLVDALAVLLKLKVIDETGYLLNAGEARKKGVPEQICRRLFTMEGENRILLTDEESPVYLTAGDIRQLQLAKGAIRAGIEILLQKEGLRSEELSHLYLAGAFGSYIKIENAVSIGLLPDIPRERISHTGNCAGTGAVMALLSEETIKNMEQYAKKIRHVELADEERFQELFFHFLAF
ncbi:MAG: ASKHA domain-containing protein [Suilimivivens sp.]